MDSSYWYIICLTQNILKSIFDDGAYCLKYLWQDIGYDYNDASQDLLQFIRGFKFIHLSAWYICLIRVERLAWRKNGV